MAGGTASQQDRIPAVEDEPSSEGVQEPPVCEVDPLDIVETSGLVRDPELTVWLGYRCFGDTFTVIPEDTPREKEGLQCPRSIPKCFSRK